MTAEPAVSKLVLVLLSIFLPPVAVALIDGVGPHLILNIVLLILGWIPAVIHALILSLR